MSWSFEFIAESKGAAKAQVEGQTLATGLPDSLAEVINASIDEQQDSLAIFVKSNGHIGGAYAHNAAFEVRGVEIARETPTPE